VALFYGNIFQYLVAFDGYFRYFGYLNEFTLLFIRSLRMETDPYHTDDSPLS
jgi:hypothetical protein